MCATMGDEMSYLCMLPLIAWNMDMVMGRKLVVLWGIGEWWW